MSENASISRIVERVPTDTHPTWPIGGSSTLKPPKQKVGKPMIRVLIVDDSASIRAITSRALDLMWDIDVIGQCSDGAQAAAAAAAVRPDVVLMDLQMPNVSGIEATRILSVQQPTVKVIIWTAGLATSAAVADAAAAGAVGFQLKTGNLVDLAAAVRAAASGKTAWPGMPPSSGINLSRPPEAYGHMC